jgi:hypothetical protein
MSGTPDPKASCAIARKAGAALIAMVSLPKDSACPRICGREGHWKAHPAHRTVCKSDKACKPFKPRTPIDDGNGGQLPDDGDEDKNDMVCYKGGFAVEHNYQMCDVTSRLSSDDPFIV